ncbi:glycoside hydrolase family 5 protein [Lachnospiraceae bacterium MD1]|uniref:Glycoside hydrolase family 5 protein n=1 Tax=Variimorphobacter saccharofermentans TaxID=2755051 RepID=A0A839K0W8_9FIRM|nr:glycoside hydrolase family 5 protein [Variimorphobacter saccharofermentans]MBB2182371.1 glycoside hydrolase family 5 protein [Variimorphobacter saccharofermentans]
MGNTMQGFQTGVNLGGWISQFRNGVKEHFDHFITEEDIKQIASWGLDHVRLPIDYNVIEDDQTPFQYKEEGFAYIDNCIKWCETYHLNIILDLHKTAGYAAFSLNENRLFEDETLQNRFLSLWKAFAERYRHYGKNVVFELLNEIVEPNSDRWNRLSKRAVDAIRSIDKNRVIIIGGNNYNSVNTLRELDSIDDENIVYTFHFYEPHLFTHQKAGWESLMKECDFVIPYPSGNEEYQKYISKSDCFQRAYDFEDHIDKETLRKYLQPAVEFMKDRNATIYCGEYGVIDYAPFESNLRWHEDICDLLLEYNIGRCAWTYKLMSFPLVDKDSKVLDERMIKIVSKR